MEAPKLAGQLFKLDVLLGAVELDSRTVPDGPNRMVFQARKRIIDRQGAPGEWSPWESCGAILTCEQREHRPWWKFWE